jgi:hypothetical protein
VPRRLRSKHGATRCRACPMCSRRRPSASPPSTWRRLLLPAATRTGPNAYSSGGTRVHPGQTPPAAAVSRCRYSRTQRRSCADGEAAQRAARPAPGDAADPRAENTEHADTTMTAAFQRTRRSSRGAPPTASANRLSPTGKSRRALKRAASRARSGGREPPSRARISACRRTTPPARAPHGRRLRSASEDGRRSPSVV